MKPSDPLNFFLINEKNHEIFAKFHLIQDSRSTVGWCLCLSLILEYFEPHKRGSFLHLLTTRLFAENIDHMRSGRTCLVKSDFSIVTLYVVAERRSYHWVLAA